MCGIVGFLSRTALDSGSHAVVRRMADQIVHRGPDDAGIWLDEQAGIALGHRRLSIIDLSPAGHQPMISPSGRYVAVYNGEIYNHRDLRVALDAAGAAPTWRGHSDTEVMLAAIEHWGVEGALSRLNGMFAFALWDREQRVLYLARDRMGEKPLYYGVQGGVLLFGSELNALRAHPTCRGDIDRDALALFLRHNYVPAPRSIWQGISKLPPAHYLRIDSSLNVGVPVSYWDLQEIAQGGDAMPMADDAALVDQLEVLLKDAVGRRMEADVPLGAFLSGGVDSSTVVALMQVQSARPVRTFSIGFAEKDYDESNHAKAVAAHLGTDHTELFVTADDALQTIPKLPAIWDEPFSDSSQIPTYLLSGLTRQHVTVSLSGDGGDELFGGYNRYLLAMKLWQPMAMLPVGMRHRIARLLTAPQTATGVRAAMHVLPRKYRHKAIADRLPKIAQLLDACSPEALYLSLVSHWQRPEDVVIGAAEPLTLLNGGAAAFSDFRQKMMYLDARTYLPDDILVKVDRASMAVSLEARVPMLDHRLVEFAWRMPLSAKIRRGTGKWALRQVLYRHVPRSLIDRPKMGFGVPIDSWLKGPLRDWAEALLDERRLREDGFFNPAIIRRKWDEYQYSGRRWHYHLWDILMFQAWHDAQAQDVGTAGAQGRNVSARV